jgi:ribosomal protein S18 acetylase RimI-like enzyme
MEIRTLEHTPLAQITASFNEAFRHYFIPLQFTEEGMAAKIKSEGIERKYSIGAFDGDQLAGFILHGYDVVDGVKTVYNAGTGVIPLARGNGLTSAMYQFAMPLLQQQGIHTHLLEVIVENHSAKKIYEAIGFRTVRLLGAYKSSGFINGEPMVTIKEIEKLPTEAFFFGAKPSWQNAAASINRDLTGHQLLGAFLDNKLVGYAAWIPASGRVRQCGVHADHRRKGIGKAIFRYMYLNSTTKQLLLTNVDEGCEPAIGFLQAMHFERFLQLYEMQHTLPEE